MPIRFTDIKLIINLVFLSVFISNNSSSEEFNVNAEYKPAAYDAEYGSDSFKNIDKCQANEWLCGLNDGEYIFPLPITANRTPINTGNKRDYPVFLNVKSKKVMLLNNANGDQKELTLIPTIVGVSMSGYKNIPTIDELFKNLIFEGDCIEGRVAAGSTRFLIVTKAKNNNLLSGCYIPFKYNPQYGNKLEMSEFYLGFRLKSPNPLKMKNGDYTGTLDLLISPEGDIDLGNGSYSASHTLNFKLSVKHQIKVDFPLSGKKVILQPNKGWGNQLTELSNEITYSLWASSNVNVSLRCQYKFNDACGIKNKKGHTVGLDVFNLENGHNRTLLTEKTPQVIKVMNPVMGNESKILFRVSNKSVTSMLNYPGSTYSGNVTIVYDASI